ncbi:hypothetical protein KP509_13G004900 [Ceratopteris richardii]|uniref:F420-0:Gamma-glutamyl ligase n=1 Tax=Ceratopteris richardii TaxID=49495 RepID=A0A8T2TCQ6_CERRI|nr:hypothetical protein KP509_13G004900 [Ceratopteris richardii]
MELPSSHQYGRKKSLLIFFPHSFPSGLLLTRGKWTWIVEESTHYQLCGIMKFYNVTRKNEVFVNEVSASVVLLSASEINDITTTVKIFSQHPAGGPATRKDGYWPVYILQAGKTTQIKVVVDVKAQHGQQLTKLQALRLDLNFVSYGTAGRCLERQNVILPVQYPEVPQNPVWQPMGNGVVLPVRTHILCHMDDPLEVVGRYAMPHIRMGDMIVIGETPLAIMQGRFRHPCNIIPSLMAKLACKLFHPTSSLATACGMQALLDISGRLRAMFAIVVAVLGRIVGVRGLFYRLAGEQARLIDDVSGTLPPYDQFITLGPVEAQNIAKSLEQKTGCGVAIVDANNLGRVHILAASSKVEPDFLKRILTSNPAGNDDEQTPLVIVRPLKAPST